MDTGPPANKCVPDYEDCHLLQYSSSLFARKSYVYFIFIFQNYKH